jgi:5-methylcytosine-specific restriction endonuclease McrA
MLREAKNCSFMPEGTWFWKRYVFVAGKLRADGGIKPQPFAEMAGAQQVQPVAVLHGEGRRWWWFRDRFYWEDDELTSADVMALVLERERRKQRKLERAHAAMYQASEAVPRRESIAREVKLAVWQRDGGRCRDCGSDFDLQYDHVIPLSMGGASSVQNLQLLCGDCNRAKGAAL